MSNKLHGKQIVDDTVIKTINGSTYSTQTISLITVLSASNSSGTYSINLNSNKIINVATGSDTLDAVNYGQLNLATSSLYSIIPQNNWTLTGITLSATSSASYTVISGTLSSSIGTVSISNSVSITSLNSQFLFDMTSAANPIIRLNYSSGTNQASISAAVNSLFLDAMSDVSLRPGAGSNVIATQPLSMVSNKIINLATGSNSLDAVNVGQLNLATSSIYSYIDSHPGSTGPTGADGINGATGPTGPSGADGATGSFNSALVGNGLTYSSSLIQLGGTLSEDTLIELGTYSMQFDNTWIATRSSQPGIYFNQTSPSVASGNWALLGSGADTYLNAPAGGRIYFTNQGNSIADAILIGTGDPRWAFNLDVRPGVNNTWELGNSTNQWKNIYSVYGLFSTGLTVSGTMSIGGQLNLNSNKIINVATGSNSLDAINLGQLDLATASIYSAISSSSPSVKNGLTSSGGFIKLGGILTESTTINLNNSADFIINNGLTNSITLYATASSGIGGSINNLLTGNTFLQSTNASLLFDLNNSAQPIIRFGYANGTIQSSISAAGNNFYFDASVGSMNFRGSPGIVNTFYNSGEVKINDQTGAASNAQFEVVNNSVNRVAQMITGIASQAADLQQWRNSSNVVLVSIGAGGTMSSGTHSVMGNKIIDVATGSNPLDAVNFGQLSSSLISEKSLTVDGGGGVITTGQKGYTTITYDGVISAWYIVSGITGSCVIDIWKANGAIPTVANTITGTEKPTLATQSINSDTSLTTWTGVTVSTGDILGWNVDSADTITNVNLVLKINRI